MSREPDPIDLIRRSNPVPDPVRLSDGPDSAFAKALVQEIITMDRNDMSTADSVRWRRRTVLLAAVLFVLMGTTVALAVGVFDPDPVDVEAILDESSEAATAHLAGWRPVLSAESVWCMYGASEGAATYASEFGLDQELTVDLLIAECADGNDVARNQSTTPDTFTLCRAVFTKDAYRQRLTATGETVIAGDLDGTRPGFPVVLSWETDCQAAQLETSWDVELAPLISLDAINHARQIEIELKASAIQSCLSKNQADEIASKALRELGDSWLLVEESLDGKVDCYEPVMDAEWGIMTVRGHDNPTPDQPTNSTQPSSEG